MLGVGEYIVPPEQLGDATNAPFTIGPNAVLVNEASPKALADATLALAGDPALRSQLGISGFQSIRDHFTWQRQIQQCESLYSDLPAPL